MTTPTEKINQLDEMLKFGNTRKEIVRRAKEIIEQREEEILEIIEKVINNNPHLFSSHKGKGKFTGCIVCKVLNKLKSQIQIKEGK